MMVLLGLQTTPENTDIQGDRNKKNEKKRTMQVHWNFTNNIENNNTHQPPYCETNWHRLTTASHFCSNALKVISTCKDL